MDRSGLCESIDLTMRRALEQQGSEAKMSVFCGRPQKTAKNAYFVVKACVIDWAIE